MVSHKIVKKLIKEQGIKNVEQVEKAMDEFLLMTNEMSEDDCNEWIQKAKEIAYNNNKMYNTCGLHHTTNSGKQDCSALDKPYCLYEGKCNFFITCEKMRENYKKYGDGSEYSLIYARKHENK